MINSFIVENKTKDAFEIANHIANSTGLLSSYRNEDTPKELAALRM